MTAESQTSTKETLRRAINDAIDWQMSLADAYSGTDDENRLNALAQAGAYRKILKRRYGTSRTPMECMGDGAEIVTLDELDRRRKP